jgi:hypothetical protein
MRVLLDEQLHVDLATELRGHTVDTVAGRGWAGIKNRELLRRMRGYYDVLVTMDRNIEFQQRIAVLPFGIVLVRAPSNRIQDLRPLAPSILAVSSRSRVALFSEWVAEGSALAGTSLLRHSPPCVGRRNRLLRPRSEPSERPTAGLLSRERCWNEVSFSLQASANSAAARPASTRSVARMRKANWPAGSPATAAPTTTSAAAPSRGYSSGTPALRSPIKYVASNNLRIFGTPKSPTAFNRAMLE